jgi:NaMN:DMB phosphoribosyltransferase
MTRRQAKRFIKNLSLLETSMTSLPGLPGLTEVEPLDQTLRAELQHIIDTKTKPPGSLGRLETLARQMGLIQRTTHPTVERPAMIVFAGDHGIAQEGVSPYPQAVTAQMVANFLAGGAAINALSRVSGVELEVVNSGIATPLPSTRVSSTFRLRPARATSRTNPR